MKSSILIVAISLFLIHFNGFSQKNETQRLTVVNLTVRDSSDNSVLKIPHLPLNLFINGNYIRLQTDYKFNVHQHE